MSVVMISRAEYNRLLAAAEELADLQAHDRTRVITRVGERIPEDYANRLLCGENALRVYRNMRGLTQAELAEKAGITRVTVTAIEGGRIRGSVATLRALAKALNVALDDLVK